MDRGPSGADEDRLHEGAHERPRLGDLACAQEFAHLLGEGGDGIGAVQQHAALGEHRPGLVGGDLQELLALAVLLDALRGVGHLQVRVLDHLPDAAHAPAHVLQLGLDRLQLLTLLARHAVHLLVQHAHEVVDVGLGEDVVAELPDDRLLEALRVEPRRGAGFLAGLDERLADVVAVLAALRLGAREGAPAVLALDQAAQQIGARGAAGMHDVGSARLEESLHPVELLLAHDRRNRSLDANRRRLARGPLPPDERARVGLVGEHPVHGVFHPAPAVARGNALVVEGAHDVEHALAREDHVEDAAHHGVGGRVELQLRALLRPVLDLHLLVAVGRVGGDPEAARGGLAHAARDLLGQVRRVELVDALDDRLHELAGGGVVGVLGDGDDADAAAAQHRLEGDGVLALAGEAAELPDEDLLEGRVGSCGGVEHLAELGAVCHAAALGLVDVLADDEVVVLLRVVAQRPQLGSDGEVDVLAVAGDARVEGGGGGFGVVCHGVFLLICVLTLA
ncbi:MAG: hypothetical protein OXH07_07600 [Chloroflexi bacterium]|nr:hypothetical protein [Chloroflexota bacterium]